MKEQTFRISVTLRALVESGNSPYLTEAIVRKQVEKFLSFHCIVEGLPCHGGSQFTVESVEEESE